MNKQNVVYTYNEILFSFKEEGNSNTCYNMDSMLSERSHIQSGKYCMIPLIYDITKAVKITETVK